MTNFLICRCLIASFSREGVIAALQANDFLKVQITKTTHTHPHTHTLTRSGHPSKPCVNNGVFYNGHPDYVSEAMKQSFAAKLLVTFGQFRTLSYDISIM